MSSINDIQKSTSSIELFLHPLVIINISDHYTRTKMNGKDSNPKVLGVLFGQQSGRKVQIKTSFEIIYQVDKDGHILLDSDFVEQKKQLYSQVIPEHEILGWYSTGEKLLEEDFLIHKQIMGFNETPLFLLCDVVPKDKQKDIPLYIFESSTFTEDEKMQWLRLDYNIETEESERITVDQVNNLELSSSTASSTLVPYFSSLTNAITMLQDRVVILIKYLEEVKKGNIPKDYEMLRNINSLCNRLPAIDSTKFKSEYIQQMNEILLITYMATMTKGTNVLGELIEKYNVAYERRGRRGMF